MFGLGLKALCEGLGSFGLDSFELLVASGASTVNLMVPYKPSPSHDLVISLVA